MRSLVFLVAAALVSFSTPAIASAASPLCPPEVKEAGDLLTAKTAIAAKMITPSKSQAGARGQQDIQAPRGQDVQAPRGQDTQAPRGQQDIQAPRGQQDIQAPRNVAKGRAAALANARKLVNEAKVACKDADGPRAAANARAALELLKYIP
ncbi:MAG: hypothetical protein HYU26_11815 [Candidatus Rokubacteria bacterium]|nr:hypothetical protein [Candidatus Rokubacteria bacterium]